MNSLRSWGCTYNWLPMSVTSAIISSARSETVYARIRGVGAQERPLRRTLENPLEGMLENGPVLLLGPPERLLGPLALGDIVGKGDDAGDFPFPVIIGNLVVPGPTPLPRRTTCIPL